MSVRAPVFSRPPGPPITPLMVRSPPSQVVMRLLLARVMVPERVASPRVVQCEERFSAPRREPSLSRQPMPLRVKLLARVAAARMRTWPPSSTVTLGRLARLEPRLFCVDTAMRALSTTICPDAVMVFRPEYTYWPTALAPVLCTRKVPVPATPWAMVIVLTWESPRK